MTASLRNAPARGERQAELDIGKGIAVLLMICVHVQEVLSHSAVQHSLFGNIVEFVTCFPAAPLFMFVMGVGIVYSRRQDAGYAIGRGALLLAMAYLLNVARGYIPWTLGIKLGFLVQDAVPYGVSGSCTTWGFRKNVPTHTTIRISSATLSTVRWRFSSASINSCSGRPFWPWP